jgi:outer membrane lipoprotein-sorting protein
MMFKAGKIIFAASLALLLTAGARCSSPAEDKDKVLRRLDAAAANFRSTSADFEFDSITNEPIYDKDVQKGTVFYERKNDKSFRMAAHVATENDKPAPKVYVYSGGVVRLIDKSGQVTTLDKLSQYESWFMLGFGASGKDLEEKWEITYLGSETLDGVKTEELEMVPKDPAIRKNLSKVEMWVDPERGVSLKQVLHFGPDVSKVCVYFNIKINPKTLPGYAFTLKIDK